MLVSGWLRELERQVDNLRSAIRSGGKKWQQAVWMALVSTDKVVTTPGVSVKMSTQARAKAETILAILYVVLEERAKRLASAEISKKAQEVAQHVAHFANKRDLFK